MQTARIDLGRFSILFQEVLSIEEALQLQCLSNSTVIMKQNCWRLLLVALQFPISPRSLKSEELSAHFQSLLTFFKLKTEIGYENIKIIHQNDSHCREDNICQGLLHELLHPLHTVSLLLGNIFTFALKKNTLPSPTRAQMKI